MKTIVNYLRSALAFLVMLCALIWVYCTKRDADQARQKLNRTIGAQNDRELRRVKALQANQKRRAEAEQSRERDFFE